MLCYSKNIHFRFRKAWSSHQSYQDSSRHTPPLEAPIYHLHIDFHTNFLFLPTLVHTLGTHHQYRFSKIDGIEISTHSIHHMENSLNHRRSHYQRLCHLRTSLYRYVGEDTNRLGYRPSRALFHSEHRASRKSIYSHGIHQTQNYLHHHNFLALLTLSHLHK